MTGRRTMPRRTSRAAARDVVKKWQGAVVNVRVVLKTRMSMGGREMQSADDSVDAVGTVIDPSGLTVMSLGSLNPGAMMNKIIGASMGSGGNDSKVEISSEPTELKIRLPDGRELAAKIVLRDEDLDLAFIRPTTKPAAPLVVDRPGGVGEAGAARSGGGAVAARARRRLGGVGALVDISAVIERPRTFYVLGGAPRGMGTPAFSDVGQGGRRC